MASPSQESTAIEQIADYFADQFDRGMIKTGDRLPSRLVLAKQFGVCGGTVSMALKRLAKRYPLQFSAGKGVFLSGKRSFTIGLIGPYASQMAHERNMSSRNYWTTIVRNMLAHCEKQQLAVTFIPDTVREPLDLDRIAAFRTDCLVSHSIPLRESTVFELKRRGLPLVLGNRGDGRLPALGVSYVDYDNIGVVREAVRILRGKGHERIACVFVQSSDEAWRSWRDAFRLEAAERGNWVPTDEYIRMAARDQRDDFEAIGEFLLRETESLLDLPEPPTGILYLEESFLLGAVTEVLKGRGLKLGKDIDLLSLAVAGDEQKLPFGVFVEDAASLGRELVETAVKQANAPHEVFQVDVPMKFVERGSQNMTAG